MAFESIKELKQRLEKAGVSPSQISQILHDQQPSQPAQLSKVERQRLGEAPNFPLNLPPRTDIILEKRSISDELDYIVPMYGQNHTRLYSLQTRSMSQRLRDDLFLIGHPGRDENRTRQIGRITFDQFAIWPQLIWENWGEWIADANTKNWTWISDTGMRDDKTWLYWKSNFNKAQTGCLAVWELLVYQDQEKMTPRVDDELIAKIEMMSGDDDQPDIITVCREHIREMAHLDEIIAVGSAVQQKDLYHVMAYLVYEKGYNMQAIRSATDLSFVPDDLDKWAYGTWQGEEGGDQAAKKAERKKTWKAAFKLGHQMAELAGNIAQATSGQ